MRITPFDLQLAEIDARLKTQTAERLAVMHRQEDTLRFSRQSEEWSTMIAKQNTELQQQPSNTPQVWLLDAQARERKSLLAAHRVANRIADSRHQEELCLLWDRKHRR